VEKQVQPVTKTKTKKRDRKIPAMLASEGGRLPSSKGGRVPSAEGGSNEARAAEHMSQRDQPTAPELAEPNRNPEGSDTAHTNEPRTRSGRPQ
jgi:hypothetical protein